MTRLLAGGLLAAAMFAVGFWSADVYERGRLWQEDRLIPAPPQVTTPAAPQAATAEASNVRFEDVAAQFTLDFAYFDGAEGNFYIVETTGGGMGVLDFDADGDQDLWLVNGSRLPPDSSERQHSSRLFRSHGELGFVDYTAEAGVDIVFYGQGAAAADYDNDGFADGLITGFGRSVLFHNNGDGTFADVTDAAAVGSNLWSTSAAFSDLDRDGQLDVYVCTYGEVPLENPLVCQRGGRRMHCLPRSYRAQPDRLFRNRGDGTFDETSESAGIRDENGRGLGLAIADLTGDDRPDIYVANDTSESFLFVSQGEFAFADLALSLGAALTGEGTTMAGMGVACADYDRNGWLDLFVTNFYEEKNVLFQNNGPSGFRDTADAAGLGASSRDRLGFGTLFLDADLDGHPDLFVANGHVSDMTHVGIPYKMRQQFYRNRGNGAFADVSDSSGPYFQQRLLGRGTAWLDVNNDGLPDVVASHIRESAALLVNRTAPHGHWLGLQFVGRRSNRDGLNVKVEVTAGGERRFFENVSGGGYLSSSDKRLLVGLGASDAVEQVVVRWPSGVEQRLDSPAADRYHLLLEPLLQPRENRP